jgi:CheY-like chemotaxis protein
VCKFRIHVFVIQENAWRWMDAQQNALSMKRLLSYALNSPQDIESVGLRRIPENQMTKIRVLVVDDYAPFCQTVRSILEGSRFEVVGEALDGSDAVQRAQNLQPDVILLDLSLPKLNGIQAAEQIRALSPHSKILMLSQDCSSDLIQAAFKEGILGYLHKSRIQSRLIPAIDCVLAENQFLEDGL